MFNRILVPLDGSKQSEASLPIAAYMAGKCHSSIFLLHVVEHQSQAWPYIQSHLQNTTDAMNYLKDQATTLEHGGAKVVVKVIDEPGGRLPDSIASVARSDGGFDLIALCRHVHHRVFDRTTNCLARQVAARVDIPMLVKCTIPSEKDIQYQPRGLALIVDVCCKNNNLLDMAREIALKCKLEVSLIVLYPEIRAMSFLGTGLGFSLTLAVADTNRELEHEAKLVANTYEREFRNSGLEVVPSLVSHHSANQIAGLLRGMTTDLIVTSLPGVDQPTSVKTFDISRFSHLPSLMVPA